MELVYDLNNHASFKLVEPLLYKSRYYDRSSQTLMLSLINGDDRPFVLSTPRLEGPNLLHLHIPFCDKRVDKLAQLKYVPASYGEIRDMLELNDKHDALLQSFLTEEAPPP